MMSLLGSKAGYCFKNHRSHQRSLAKLCSLEYHYTTTMSDIIAQIEHLMANLCDSNHLEQVVDNSSLPTFRDEGLTMHFSSLMYFG